ncbi:hypothetical protein [Legionella worsleiensis]|uniref:Dot/Icm secretion system substrate n=1 Tax=Legionella worsleiensis TaxID=45076 RepID=A0A0W1A9J5_9GAMM|nr:hypothetical protein [Legionella worsleiensis]KTD77963.1 Dot/Icm secretion system substrate [Legionella worsleiensis]STY31588.1 Dot/Icm secretion system substrate [Legionella worsleiensis]
MVALSNVSSEFSLLVKELHKKPDNPALKQELVSRMAEMKALARKNPLDLYRLAQVYAPTSPQYKNMMRQSAASGCTNAMLSLTELLLKSGSSNDLKTAAYYMRMIEASKDTHIIKQSRAFLSLYPELAQELRTTVKAEQYHSKIRFFSAAPEHAHQQQDELHNDFAL